MQTSTRGSASAERWALLGALALTLGMTGCGQSTGNDAAGNTSGQDGASEPADGAAVDAPAADAGNAQDASTDQATDAASCVASESFVGARISLISDAQFINAVRDVFAVALEAPVTTRPPSTGSYLYRENDMVNEQMVKDYVAAADRVAHQLKPCGASPVDATCLESFVRQTLPRAWRRPVTDDEIRGIAALFGAGLGISATRAVEVVMEAVLTSGSFLYQTEIGPAPPSQGSITLTAYELASAVSFALTDSVPDQGLVQKAQDGTLIQATVLSAEVDRLLATPGVQANLQKFVSHLFELERIPFATKDAAAFPELTSSARAALYLGGQKFLGDVMQKGHFADLFTSRRVYANQELASVYGIPGVTGPDWVAVDLPGDVRAAGILTQPAFLAASNQHPATDDIVHRGLAIYNAVVCGSPIAAEPANAAAVFATLTGGEHEKATKRDALAACGACHNLFDPFGFASEAYDAIGRYRSSDPDHPGMPIDTTATIKGLGPDLDGPVNGLNDLASRLAKGRRASDCAALHLVMMTLDHPSTADGSCEVQRVKDAFAQTGSFADLFKAIVMSPAFRTRGWEGR